MACCHCGNASQLECQNFVTLRAQTAWEVRRFAAEMVKPSLERQDSLRAFVRARTAFRRWPIVRVRRTIPGSLRGAAHAHGRDRRLVLSGYPTTTSRARSRDHADGERNTWMDDATRMDVVRQLLDFEPAEIEQRHAHYHDDAVLELPQSQERFEGKANFLAWRTQYPATVEAKIRRILGRGDVWVAELSVRYDGGPWHYGCGIHEFRGDKISRETIYFAEAFDAPDWRAPWRATWQDETLG